jgi:hypothetical protein
MEYQNNRNINNDDRSVIIFNNYLNSYLKNDLKTIYEQYKQIAPLINKKQGKSKDTFTLIFALFYLFLVIPFSLILLYGLVFDNSVLTEIKTFINSIYMSILPFQKIIAGWMLINLIAFVGMCLITAYIVRINSTSPISWKEFFKIFFYSPEWVLSKDRIQLKALYFAVLDPYRIRDVEFIRKEITNLWHIYFSIKTHNLDCRESFWFNVGHTLGLFIPTILIFTESIIYAIEQAILWEIDKVERDKTFFGVEEKEQA